MAGSGHTDAERTTASQTGRSKWIWLFWLVSLGLVGTAGFYGARYVDRQHNHLQKPVAGERQIDPEEFQQLKADLADAELGARISEGAAAELQTGIQDLERQVADLNEEIKFYKSLMAPSSLARGLQVADFTVGQGVEATHFGYQVVLTQVETRKNWIQGDLRIEVKGDLLGETVVLPLTELGDIENYPIKFRFRYFQGLKGEFRLPDGFTPEAVVISAKKAGQKQPVQKSFTWAVEI